MHIYPSLLPIWSQLSPVHALSVFLYIHFKITFPFMSSDQSSSSFLPSFQTKMLYELPISPMCYVFCPPYRPWLDHAKNIWHRIHTMKLLITQFLPKTLTSCMSHTIQICTVWLGSCNLCNLACFLQILNILHQTSVYALSLHTEPDSFQLKFWYYSEYFPKSNLCPHYPAKFSKTP